jgi:hypothetical protein
MTSSSKAVTKYSEQMTTESVRIKYPELRHYSVFLAGLVSVANR